MYLKEIITSGFKSFADKIDIKLDGKTTCIVGPNGSGKSNIVDAVRWVLGEQSIKSLRGGGSMSDVIFSGSKSRKALNVATVELIFDNSDYYINIPYTEISIKRRVYRSGENEYYLNNEKCRLKDITNLLIDTGMAKESFNIISQGEVEKIISNSANDRRAIFEEAASILKYKKRKEEALHKLDKTHSNLERINDIIAELELQIEPLKKQSEQAKIYLENKKGLDKYEVALLAYDIDNINSKLEQNKQKKEKIEREILAISSETSKTDANSINDNISLEKLENEQANLNNELVIVSAEVEKINGEKNLLIERSKTNTKEAQRKEKMRLLLEKKAQIERSINVLEEEMQLISLARENTTKRITEVNDKLTTLKAKRNLLNSDFSKHSQDLISLNHKISLLKVEIEQNGDAPTSVKKVLTNSNLMGIHNTIGNILQTEEKYVKALNVVLASNKNFIITTDEEAAKLAINYLKDNHLGRATFFPLSIIKAREIDYDSLNMLKNNKDFIGVLSELVSYNKKYQNIIKNQFGTIIVTTNIDAATKLSHLIKARYKIVTLDGDVVNVGGSLQGGSSYNSKSIIMTKQELKQQLETEKILQEEAQEITSEIDTLAKEITTTEEQVFTLSKENVHLNEEYKEKNGELLSLNENLTNLNKEVESLELINNNTISEKEQELIKLYHEKCAVKEQIQLKLKALNKDISLLKDKIEKNKVEEKYRNNTLHNLEKTSRELEVKINRADVKLDNMLMMLANDYELSFEKARSDYKLDIEPEEARLKVNTLKNNIKKIGMVNLAAIDEYERVNTRYIFLTNQKEDLLKAEDTLLEIMNEMDGVMIEEFKNTFTAIQKEFKQVFRSLFGGGDADLKLTDPTDLLTTGIEIEVSPPGKKLTTISLLSGGEKTLTAISLLFAILNVRPVPFCLFDEVEAALDEANVSRFGEYLANYKDITQFLIITHKKKTMEYANSLYGITMQESGVSKLVSVKLEDSKELI